ncbi:hypothetical protein HanIR_Chr05g0244841 [Helianthus annuus]|nr:hypothetical protein HanIR_Chr05g0244841 [Helianthus annuus]
MARVKNWYNNQSKSASLIWFISLLIFYAIFRMASKHSPLSFQDVPVSNGERLKLYEKMSRDLDEHGALFLKHGETSQSLLLSDLFDMKNGSVTPALKAAIPPVRANVLHLSTEYSLPISKAVRDVFSPTLSEVIWFQNSERYHFSMFHASHHISPVPASSEEEVEAEVDAVKSVVNQLCPVTILLDRVVLTSTGVLLGCWQVISGTDPVTIRAKLRNALPRAPEKQLYAPAILHTSLARILGHPKNSSEETNVDSELKHFHELVARLNSRIVGTKATVSELWYVEEYDVLALALDGKMKIRRFQFGCSKA